MPIIRMVVVLLSVSVLMWAVSAGVASASSELPTSPTPVHTVTTTTPTGSPVARVNVQNDNGDITFLPGSPGTVTRTEAWNVGEPSYSQSLINGTLTIRAQCPSAVPDNDCSDSLVITVPSTVDIDASTTNGKVQADGLQSPTVAASSTNGDVNVSLDAPPTNLSMSTINGAIYGTVPAGPYALTTDTINGQVIVTGIENDPTASDAVSAHNVNGDITVRGV